MAWKEMSLNWKLENSFIFTFMFIFIFKFLEAHVDRIILPWRRFWQRWCRGPDRQDYCRNSKCRFSFFINKSIYLFILYIYVCIVFWMKRREWIDRVVGRRQPSKLKPCAFLFIFVYIFPIDLATAIISIYSYSLIKATNVIYYSYSYSYSCLSIICPSIDPNLQSPKIARFWLALERKWDGTKCPSNGTGHKRDSKYVNLIEGVKMRSGLKYSSYGELSSSWGYIYPMI